MCAVYDAVQTIWRSFWSWTPEGTDLSWLNVYTVENRRYNMERHRNTKHSSADDDSGKGADTEEEGLRDTNGVRKSQGCTYGTWQYKVSSIGKVVTSWKTNFRQNFGDLKTHEQRHYINEKFLSRFTVQTSRTGHTTKFLMSNETMKKLKFVKTSHTRDLDARDKIYFYDKKAEFMGEWCHVSRCANLYLWWAK